MADSFSRLPATIDGPSVDGFVIVANDTNIFAQTTRSVYVGVSGNVAVMMANKAQTQTNLTFTNVVAGTTLPIRIMRVYSTGSTANNLIGMF